MESQADACDRWVYLYLFLGYHPSREGSHKMGLRQVSSFTERFAKLETQYSTDVGCSPMRNTPILLNKIVDYLMKFKLRIQSYNNLGLYDVNTLSQKFVKDMLNIIYHQQRAKFKVLDDIKSNYPAIDFSFLYLGWDKFQARNISFSML